MKIKLSEAIEEKRELFNMIEELRERHTEDLKIYKDKVIDTEAQVEGYLERINQLDVELSYEKEYHSKSEDTVKDLTEQKDKACKEVELQKQDLDKQK